MSITTPSAGATVTGTVNIAASAADNVGVAAVHFNVDGVNLGSEVLTAPYQASWNTRVASNGPHTLTAVARDAAGNVTLSAPVAITVSNAVANLAAAYSYDEGTGTIAGDSSTNANTATLSGAAWSAACKFGRCLSFDGSTAYVESPDINALTPGTAATFEAWVSLGATPPETASIINKWSQTVDDEYMFGIDTNRTLFFAWQTTGGGSWPSASYNSANGTGTVPLNTLTHVAVVRNGATLSFYINGTLDASLTVMDANPFRQGITTLRVGGQSRGGRNRFFTGIVDEVRIYTRALSQAEIQADMNAPIGVAPPDTTPPVISSVAASAISSSGATITWTTGEASDSAVEYGTTTAYGNTGTPNSTQVTSHTVALTGLAANTLYHYRARSRDAAGNLGVSGDFTFTTLEGVPPTVAITAPADGSTVVASVTVSATATDNVGVVGVQFKLDGVNLGAENTAAPYSISWDTTGVANGTHSLSAVARDAAGNTAAAAVSVTVANTTTAIIDPSRRIDWSQAGIVGGIPNRTNICATLTATATSAQINSAIASCSGGVVMLNAGTYTLTGGLNFGGKSNVTLRGAGVDQTVLKFTGADNCGGNPADVCVKGSSSVGVWGVPTANVRNWTAGYAKGTTQITLDSTSGIAVGMILILDQLEDLVDTGGVVVNGQHISAFSIEGVAPGRPDRTQTQYVKVTAISGNQVTISPGLYMPNWRASQVPQAWFWGTTAQTASMDGIESMTLDHSGNTSETAGIMFWNAYGGWVTGVKSLNTNRNHIWVYQAARIEVRDNYFYGTLNAATSSYGVEGFMTSDNLIVNNIFQHIACPVMTGPSTGTVAAYNYMLDMYYGTNTNWNVWGINGSHDSGTGMNLFEGNEGNGFGMDLYHGPGAYPTVFRNYFTGRDGSRALNTEVVSVWAYNRFVNFVGNVLGTPGFHTVYEDSRGPQGVTGNPYHSIFLLGYSAVDEGTTSGILYDQLVISTMLRWGNFDYATNQTRWNAAEVPSGNPVPANHTLPPSLFLTAKPSWWGAMPWPAIGPDVTGGQDSAGHVFKNPAHLCFDSTPKNPDGTLKFDPSLCY